MHIIQYTIRSRCVAPSCATAGTYVLPNVTAVDKTSERSHRHTQKTPSHIRIYDNFAIPFLAVRFAFCVFSVVRHQSMYLNDSLRGHRCCCCDARQPHRGGGRDAMRQPASDKPGEPMRSGPMRTAQGLRIHFSRAKTIRQFVRTWTTETSTARPSTLRIPRGAYNHCNVTNGKRWRRRLWYVRTTDARR